MWPGSRHALSLGASGWSILAYQPERVIEKALRKTNDPDAARRRIAETRQLGYAISHDELQLGVHGLAVPLINRDGRCDASLGILVPSSRNAGLVRFIDPLLAAAALIAEALRKG